MYSTAGIGCEGELLLSLLKAILTTAPIPENRVFAKDPQP